MLAQSSTNVRVGLAMFTPRTKHVLAQVTSQRTASNQVERSDQQSIICLQAFVETCANMYPEYFTVLIQISSNLAHVAQTVRIRFKGIV